MVSFKSCQFLFVVVVVGKKIHFVSISFKQCVRIVSMSLFKYFVPVKDKVKSKCSDAGSIANACTFTSFLLYQSALINDQLNAFFMSIRVYYVRVNFVCVKTCIVLISYIKLHPKDKP